MKPSFGLIRLIIKSARRIKRIHQALERIEWKMNTMVDQLDDVLAQEKAEGDSITKLVALTDAIFAMLSTGPSPDPRVRQVLDMIAANKQTADDAVVRDTPAA